MNKLSKAFFKAISCTVLVLLLGQTAFGQETFSSIIVGRDNEDGLVVVSRNDGNGWIRLRGDRGRVDAPQVDPGGEGFDGIVKIRNANSDETIRMFGRLGEIQVGGRTVDGQLKIRNANSEETIRMFGRLGEIQVGGRTVDGQLKIRNANSEETIRMFGRLAQIQIGSERIAGSLRIADAQNINAIELNGETGTTTTRILQITGGGDLAELFEIAETESIKPGMVVSIDPEHPGELLISNKAYDRTVAGIISEANGLKPGLTMEQRGSKADGTFPVALTGRVYCRADTSNGSIQPGDLLTTAHTPGHAMKVTDYAKAQGAIIGKAMSSLDEGRGLVLVLVTLQ